MNRIRLLRNPIREYAWGSRTALAEILGEPSPAPRPQAELWMGAHPAAPSAVRVDSAWVPLDAWIRRDPVAVLGPEVARAWEGRLPFLLKLLAAEQPLSLQAHPDAAQARAGFERENAAGVPLDAPERNYRDPNPKPELVCAVSPFTALCGFRPIDDAVDRIDALGAPSLARMAARLRAERTRASLRGFFEALLRLPAADRGALVGEAVEAAEGSGVEAEVRGWIRTLAKTYPGDPGVLAPLLLNLVELRPGEALFLPAGELHAHLGGTAVEIMASSDNVLRGGLTAKHVDVDELLETLTFATRPPEKQLARRVGPLESVYDTPAREFSLSMLRLGEGSVFRSEAPRSVEILFGMQGTVTVEPRGAGEPIELRRGMAALIPAAVESYRLIGAAELYRASVPRFRPQAAARTALRSA